MSQILYAKPVIDSNLKFLKSKTKDFVDKYAVTPLLKVILVGDDAGSLIYTKNKKKFCEKIGAQCDINHLDSNISETDFLEIINQYNSDNDVHGILIQLPLPKHLKHLDTSNLVVPSKDVDGFHWMNISKLYHNDTSGLLACTPKGIKTLLDFYDINLSGKNVVVIGRSLIVGRPLSLLLSNFDATVTLAHSKTKNLEDLTKQADIIISACGKAKLLNENFFRHDKSQVVIDVGISYLESGEISGDCDFKAVAPLVNAITPVPGGIGPMTIFSVAQNLLQSLENSI